MDYTLRFVNNSPNSGDVCLFQQDPGLIQDVMPLAWFTKETHPNTNVKFTWGIDYSFVWSAIGSVKPGVIFDASEVLEADLENENLIPFDFIDGAFEFVKPAKQGEAGSLTIMESANIPFNSAAVGIGMSGSGTFVIEAQPNLNLSFTPHPEYWIAFGNYTEGEILDFQTMTNVQQIKFPTNIYSMTAILNEDNSWTIEPTMKFDPILFKKKNY